ALHTFLQPRQDQVSSIEMLAQSVQDALYRNWSHPMVKAISEEVSKATQELASQAVLIDRRRMEVEGFTDSPTVTQAELDDLKRRLDREKSPQVREVMMGTLERKYAELENINKMSES